MAKPSFIDNHIMPRGCEIVLGVLFMVIGVWLLYLAFEARGKKMIWPFSGLMPV